jgi:dephospho-CoA kinase
VAARGLPRTHDNERLVREDLRASEGMAVMAKRSVPVIREHLAAGRKVAIDGIYSMAEVEVLREALGNELFIIAIHAPKALRQARAAVRGERPMTPEELDARDAKELEALDKARPIVLADTHVVNGGDERDLARRIFGALSDSPEQRDAQRSH